MRTILILAPALLALVLAPAASAQDDCSQADPCLWLVDVDETGLHGDGTAPHWNFTAGDWFVLNVTNLDEVEHTLMLSGTSFMLQVAPFDEAESEPFRFTEPGSYELVDDLGRKGTVQVLAGDVNDQEIIPPTSSSGPSGTTTSNGAPALPLATFAMALVVAVALRRR